MTRNAPPPGLALAARWQVVAGTISSAVIEPNVSDCDCRFQPEIGPVKLAVGNNEASPATSQATSVRTPPQILCANLAIIGPASALETSTARSPPAWRRGQLR